MLLASEARMRANWRRFVWACLWLVTASCVLYMMFSRLTHYQEHGRPVKVKGNCLNASCYFTSETSSLFHSDISARGVSQTKVSNDSCAGAMRHKRGPLFLTLNGFHSGRLGNHMFMYASLIGVARTLKREPFISPGFSLDLAFKLGHLAEVPDSEKWTTVSETSYATFDKGLLKKLLRGKCRNINTTISGYFQSWKYFKDITSEIRKEFTFWDSIHRQRDRILHEILPTRRTDVLLVGVHVRRSDLMTNKNIALGYTTPNASYFVKAFKWMRSHFYNQKMIFLVVTDDIPWSKNKLAGSDVVFVPPSPEGIHLSLLASCDHVIISTGSFGWWGAWLAGGHVVYYKSYPARGTNLSAEFTKDDYFPATWVGLGD